MRLYQYRAVILLGVLLSFASVAIEPPKSAQAPDQRQLLVVKKGAVTTDNHSRLSPTPLNFLATLCG